MFVYFQNSMRGCKLLRCHSIKLASTFTGNAWDSMDISKVLMYFDPDTTEWHQTSSGIAVIVVCCVLGVAAIAASIGGFVLWRKLNR